MNVFEGGNLNGDRYCSGNLEVSWSSTIFPPCYSLPLLQAGTRLLWKLSSRMTTEPCLPTRCRGMTVLLEGRVSEITFQLLKRGFILLCNHLAYIYTWKSLRSQQPLCQWGQWDCKRDWEVKVNEALSSEKGLFCSFDLIKTGFVLLFYCTSAVSI